MNADSYASTGQGVLGHNMFAYCGNNIISFYEFTDNSSSTHKSQTEKTSSKTNSPGTSSQPGSNCGEAYITTLPFVPTVSVDLSFFFRDVTSEVNAALFKTAELAEKCRQIVDAMPLLEAVGGEVGLYSTFYSLVNHGAIWDIKRPKSWNITIGTMFPGTDVPVFYAGMFMTPEDLGNFSYGYIGAAFGFDCDVLLVGSLYAAKFPEGRRFVNETEDWKWVTIGYMFYSIGYR